MDERINAVGKGTVAERLAVLEALELERLYREKAVMEAPDDGPMVAARRRKRDLRG